MDISSVVFGGAWSGFLVPMTAKTKKWLYRGLWFIGGGLVFFMARNRLDNNRVLRALPKL
jgi:hypothetical protein